MSARTTMQHIAEHHRKVEKSYRNAAAEATWAARMGNEDAEFEVGPLQRTAEYHARMAEVAEDAVAKGFR